ncbi:MAG: hypothetical protein M0005_14195 [Actinomycetota bacterium]|jgi:hypothetical protein|nr:hypothetical protein [Actinomycetota bacterium]
MRSFAQIMVVAGMLLILLAAYSLTGNLNKADQVADALAIGTSLVVTISGLVFLLVTRGDQRIGGAPAAAERRQR